MEICLAKQGCAIWGLKGIAESVDFDILGTLSNINLC